MRALKIAGKALLILWAGGMVSVMLGLTERENQALMALALAVAVVVARRDLRPTLGASQR